MALFIDNDFKGVTSFYSAERDTLLSNCQADDYVDTLSLYTLTPGVESSFANLRVCEDFCPAVSGDSLLKDNNISLEDPFKIFESHENGAMNELLN